MSAADSFDDIDVLADALTGESELQYLARKYASELQRLDRYPEIESLTEVLLAIRGSGDPDWKE